MYSRTSEAAGTPYISFIYKSNSGEEMSKIIILGKVDSALIYFNLSEEFQLSS